MYSDALNASLQSALGFAENNLPFLAHSGASMASFHHHQQQQQRERENADKHSLERYENRFPFFEFFVNFMKSQERCFYVTVVCFLDLRMY